MTEDEVTREAEKTVEHMPTRDKYIVALLTIYEKYIKFFGKKVKLLLIPLVIAFILNFVIDGFKPFYWAAVLIINFISLSIIVTYVFDLLEIADKKRTEIITKVYLNMKNHENS